MYFIFYLCLVQIALATVKELNYGKKMPMGALSTARGTGGSGVALTAPLTVMAPVKHLNDGNKMPMVALGTGRGTAAPGTSNAEVRNATYWAIESGYRHIDTAAMYNDENEVGQGIADAIAKGLVKREDLFITTKLWNSRHARAQVVPALRESLSRLGLEYVDLYLIHWPIPMKEDRFPDDIDYLETWASMEDAKALGLAKSIGVSNFNSSQLDRLLANGNVKPAVNQIEVSPTFTQEALVDHCNKLNIAVMAYSPFGYLVSRKKDSPRQPKQANLEGIAKKYGKSVMQIALRYLIERGLTPIPKSTNKERIAQNIDIFDFKLSKDEVTTISKCNTNVRVIDVKFWKEYPYYPFVDVQ